MQGWPPKNRFPIEEFADCIPLAHVEDGGARSFVPINLSMSERNDSGEAVPSPGAVSGLR